MNKSQSCSTAELQQKKARPKTFYLIFFLSGLICWALSLLFLLILAGPDGVYRYFRASILVFVGIFLCYSLAVTAMWLTKREDIQTILYDPIEDMTPEQYEKLLRQEHSQQSKLKHADSKSPGSTSD